MTKTFLINSAWWVNYSKHFPYLVEISTYYGRESKCLEEKTFVAESISLKDEEVSICGHLSTNGSVTQTEGTRRVTGIQTYMSHLIQLISQSHNAV